MASKCIEQSHLFLLYQSVILGVIDYGLGLTTLSQPNLLKLDKVQNEVMTVILGTTKDTSIEIMRYLLDLPSMETRHKVEQVKAYLNAMQALFLLILTAFKGKTACRGRLASFGFRMSFLYGSFYRPSPHVRVSSATLKRATQTRSGLHIHTHTHTRARARIHMRVRTFFHVL